MSLAETSIRRPVMTIVFSIVIIVFGLIGFTRLGVREYPAVDPPIVTVSTSYAGASADVIESQITEPLESSINGIGGVKALTSTSREGRSQITVEFEIGVDLEAAANDVRDRVSRSLRNLPPDADPPSVAKADADANPILFLTIGSNSRNPLELNDVATNFIKERLQTINGVSEITIFGEKKYAMRISLDPDRMAAYRLTPQDVRTAINAGNVELPSGRIEGSATEMTVRTEGRLATPEEFNNLVIKEDAGRTVRLSEIGKAELTAENLRTSLRRDGTPMVGLGVLPQPGANNVAIADAVYERLEKMKSDLDKAGVTVGVGFDITTGIRRSIEEVIETIAIAFALVVVIIFLFLRDWRTTLIPTLAIPVSLIGVFAIMSVAGFSINILTLLGIVLAIGLVVDDAIVVLENIYARIEEGMRPMEAAFKGSKEIVVAVVATTVVLIAVFMPLLFLQGLTGKLFVEFGVVIAGSVLISAFVALTLTPMLSGRILKGKSTGWFYRVSEPFFEKVTHGYKTSLETFMRHRWLAFPIMVAAGGLIYIVGGTLQSELAPLEDKGRLRVSATAQEGATYGYTSNVMTDLAEMLKKQVPERDGIIEIIGGGGGSVNSGFVNLVLKDREARGEEGRSQQQIAEALNRSLAGVSAARISTSQEPTIGDRRAGLPVQFVLQTSSLDKLREVLPKFMAEAQKDPTFQFVDVNLKFNRPELRVQIDRDKAEASGVSALDVAQTLQLALSEGRIGYFIRDSKQYQVIGQIDRNRRAAPGDLRSIYVRSNKGELIQLDNLVKFTDESSPPQLFRYNRSVSATVSANLAQGKTIGDGIAAMREIAARTLDASFTTELAGSSRDFAESSSTILFAFMLALLLVYLILAAQFESFRDPFIILLTVPLALAGAVLSLWYFGQTLNIFSQIGIIMLVGLVTKNGILIVEFGNQRKEQGLKVRDAVIDAAAARFRPIVMTSLATMLGALPIALALGAGAQSRVSMGIAIIGGLLLSAGLTLYVIPAIYSYLSREHKAEDPVMGASAKEEPAKPAPVVHGDLVLQGAAHDPEA